MEKKRYRTRHAISHFDGRHYPKGAILEIDPNQAATRHGAFEEVVDDEPAPKPTEKESTK